MNIQEPQSDEKKEYIAPIVSVIDVEIEQAFLQSSGSASGFEDGGSL